MASRLSPWRWAVRGRVALSPAPGHGRCDLISPFRIGTLPLPALRQSHEAVDQRLQPPLLLPGQIRGQIASRWGGSGSMGIRSRSESAFRAGPRTQLNTQSERWGQHQGGGLLRRTLTANPMASSGANSSTRRLSLINTSMRTREPACFPVASPATKAPSPGSAPRSPSLFQLVGLDATEGMGAGAAGFPVERLDLMTEHITVGIRPLGHRPQIDRQAGAAVVGG